MVPGVVPAVGSAISARLSAASEMPPLSKSVHHVPAFRTCPSMWASAPIPGVRSINGKACPAAAGGLGVGVAHREVAAHQFIGIVEFRSGQQIEAGRKADLRLSTMERLAKAHRIKLARLLEE